jgi:sugar lactone lactonase YvrE
LARRFFYFPTNKKEYDMKRIFVFPALALILAACDNGGGPGYVPPVYDWVVSTIAGSGPTGAGNGGFADGAGTAARFNLPLGITWDTAGNLYVTDAMSSRIRKIADDGLWTVTTIAGDGTSDYADGAGIAARFNLPTSVTVDAAGNLYIADSRNRRIRKIANDGLWTVTTIAGDGTTDHADGAGTAARFKEPFGVTVDAAGNLYVVDSFNNRIRKIANDGPWTVTTIAGDGTSDYADGAGTAARFDSPCGIAVDAAGNLYVADTDNHRIRKIDPTGNVTTIAGGGTNGHADGAGTAARFNMPYGIAIDAAGNLYVADTGNHRIRKIDPTGNVTTIAGGGTNGHADGAGTAARFNMPYGVAIDATGNLYVADTENHRIRKLSYQRIN